MKKIDFNKEWLFSLNGKEKIKVDVPYDFSIVQKRSKDAPSGLDGGYFPGGLGEYEKSFKARKGKKYFLLFEGVFGIAEIFINANSVFVNKYGYNAFVVDLSDFIRYDRDNLVYVRVNNRHQPNARWYSGSGIYRDVSLYESDESYIEVNGIHVLTDSVENDVAYMSANVSFYSAKNQEGCLEFEVFEEKSKKSVCTFKKFFYAICGKNTVKTKFQFDSPKLWNIDTPFIYGLKSKLVFESCTDMADCTFGVRTIRKDSKRGLLINGQSVKLRGGCLHHDHGPVGAAVYKESEYRRVALLKKAGFNAIRCSHNPQSRYFYDACDHLGMFVVDELFDYWTEGKQIEDSHLYFKENYINWIDDIVKNDINHPSIIMWSTGNEIPQKAGRGYGYQIAKSISDEIRKYDTSRLITHGLCGFWENKEESEKERATYDYGPDKIDYWADRTKITADTLDVCGYNYFESRIENDLIRFPDRIIMNTESFPLCAYTTIKQLKANDRIVGDFVWTAWDYFGETGIGHIVFLDEKLNPIKNTDYPYHISNCGDIDICGNRRPQSYYREISWGIRKDPYIAVRHPKMYGLEYKMSAWGFYDCDRKWRFDGYEGTKTEVYVFADCDELVLEINGKEVGRQSKTENGTYKFDVVYKKGEIRAKAFVKGKKIGEDVIITEGNPFKLVLSKEPCFVSKSKKEEKVIYIDVSVVDNNSNICTDDNSFIRYNVEGAKILGIGSDDLLSEEDYFCDSRKLYKGRGLLVIKKDDNADFVTVNAKSDKFETKLTF